MLSKTIQFAKTKDGLHQIPLYAFEDWRLTPRTTHHLVYRPSQRTVARRLGLTLICIAIIALVYYGAIRETSAESVRLAWMAFAGLPALIGLYAPLSAAWNRIDIQVDSQGLLRVRHAGLISKTRSWPRDAFDRIEFGANQVVHRSRGNRSYHGYRWFVRLMPRPTDGARAALGDPMPAYIEFQPHHQADRPVDQMRPPKRVQQLVAWLQEMTGAEASGPTIGDADAQGRVSNVVRRKVVTEPLESRTRRFDSVDDMPPELRAQFDRMQAEGRTEMVRSTTIRMEGGHIIVRDGSGHEQTYRSADELPPDLRAMYERMRQHFNR